MTAAQTFSGATIFSSTLTVGPTVLSSTANYTSVLKNGWTVVASTNPSGVAKTCLYGIVGNYEHRISWNFTQNTSNGVPGIQWNNDSTAGAHKWHTTYDVTTAGHFYDNSDPEWNVFNGNAISSGGQWNGEFSCWHKPGAFTQVNCFGTGVQDGDAAGDGFGHLTMSGQYANTTATIICFYTSAGTYTGDLVLSARVRGTQ